MPTPCPICNNPAPDGRLCNECERARVFSAPTRTLPAVTFGRCVTWTNFDGSTHSVTVDGCASAQEASDKVWDIVLRDRHYSPPRWWQWWRRSEPRPPARRKR